MFPKPPPILQTSLHAIANNPQDYFADVCFRYDSGEVWAHKAILLTRAPKEFQDKLLSNVSDAIVNVDLSEEFLPKDMLQRIIRFWYTATFAALSESDVVSSIQFSALSLTDSKVSSTTTLSEDSDGARKHKDVITPPAEHIVEESPPPPPDDAMRTSIERLEATLGFKFLPLRRDGLSDHDQWVSDLGRMRTDRIMSDVVVAIAPTQGTPNTTPAIVTTDHDATSFAAHRFLLAAQSPYFNALFNSHFKEASSNVVHVPAELFNLPSLDCILGFYYTGSLVIPKAPVKKSIPAATERLTQKKFALRLLQKVFRAADYLGQTNSICALALHQITTICDNFKCSCADCQLLLPSVLSFSDRVAATVPQLRPLMIRLYSDPIQGIAKLWPQKPFALLVRSMGVMTEDTGSNSFLVQPERTPSPLIGEISSQTMLRITKHNAIQAFHAMHLCLSQLRASDPFPTWSQVTLSLLNPVIHHNVLLVAMNFDYFCVEYPILLSCVDGIGFGFSCDFLDFLLNRVLDEGLQDSNAGALYQGIVRDLIGRQEVVHNIAVGEVLESSRAKCVAYLRRRWVGVKAQNGFKDLDKDVMRAMAEDIGVPYRTLAKPMDSDFMNLFSFKAKTSKVDVEAAKKSAAAAASQSRRLSLGGLRRSRSNSNTKQPRSTPSSPERESRDISQKRPNSLGDATDHSNQLQPPPVVPRALSSDAATQLKDYSSVTAPLVIPQRREPQAMLDLLNIDTETRQRRQAARHAPPSSDGSFSSLTDVLLPIESVSTESNEDTSTAPRQSRLKFALPETPARAKSPNRRNRSHSPNRQPAALRYSKQRKSRSNRWSLSAGSDTSDDDESTYLPITIGARVELLRRPLPTQGYVRYLGKLAGQDGAWAGVELDSRVGKNDGSVDGQRYFQTDSQRGIFVRENDLVVLASQT